MDERAVNIKTAQGELITITSGELSTLEPTEVIELLLSEKAPLPVWYSALLEYWRLNQLEKFEVLLRKTLSERCE